MNKYIVLVSILFLNCKVFSQFAPGIEYRKDIITSHSIKKIIIWRYPDGKTLSASDSLPKYYKMYDTKGNQIIYRHSDDNGNFNQGISYEFDSANNLVFTYFVEDDSSISHVKEKIYKDGEIIEEREYNESEVKIKDRYKVRTGSYRSISYTKDKNRNCVYKSHCIVNDPPELDSIAETYDSSIESIVIKSFPRNKINHDSAECNTFLESLYDLKGNLIRQKTIPGARNYIYKYDSFSYDYKNNLIFQISFNSPHIHVGNGREYKEGINQFERLENEYNSRGQLVRIKRYFNGNTQAFLSTTFNYYPNGRLEKKIVMKYYLKGTWTDLLIDGRGINGLAIRIINSNDILKGSWLYDTAEYYQYTVFGDLVDKREYYGMAQEDKEGTLHTRTYFNTNELGIPTYRQDYYGKILSFLEDDEIKPEVKYEYFYTHYKNGLIKEIKDTHEGINYRIEYEFY